MNVNINLDTFIRELYAKTTYQNIDLFDGFDKYLMKIKQQKSEGTYLCYSTHSVTIIKDLNKISVFYWNQIDNEVISKYVNMMQLRKVSNATINKRVNLIIRAYKYLAKNSILPATEFDFESLKEQQKEIEIISEQNLIRIINYAKENLCTRSRLIIFLLIATGIRRSELAKIRVSNINFSKNRIYLIETKSMKSRYCFFDDEIKELIKNVIKDEEQFYLFENNDRSRITVNAIGKVVNRMGHVLGIPKLTPHKFRHTYATRLLKNGADIGTVRILMGHSSLEVTHRYLDYTDDEIQLSNIKFNPLSEIKQKKPTKC